MWYTVQPGDSLYLIAARFGTTVEAIMRSNRLTGSTIYVGQEIYIPIIRQNPITYTVQPGDSLYTIARKYNTTITGITYLNNLQGTSLNAGTTLRIPLYSEAIINVERANLRTEPAPGAPVAASMVSGARLPVTGENPTYFRVNIFDGRTAWVARNQVTFKAYDGSKPIIGVIGFYTLQEGPTLPSSFRVFANNTASQSETALFMWRISAANPTTIEKFGDFTDQDVINLVSIGHRNNVKMLPVVHNLLYNPGGTTLAKNVVKELVRVPENRQAFALNLVNLIQRYNFDGVLIDIEDVFIEDSARLSLLYQEISRTLHARGYFFSSSVPARVSDQPFNPFSDPFDYAAIGAAVDQFVVMLYNEHGWPGSGPGPVVSIGWMERVLRYTITKMPKEKVYAAVSVFGFDFNLTTNRNTYVTYSMAVDLAKKYNQQIIFDQPTQTPMFRYTDEQGNKHEVWFEDAQSIRAKAELAWRLGIGGIALWRMGMEDPAIWTMLQSDVVVKKIISQY